MKTQVSGPNSEEGEGGSFLSPETAGKGLNNAC